MNLIKKFKAKETTRFNRIEYDQPSKAKLVVIICKYLALSRMQNELAKIAERWLWDKKLILPSSQVYLVNGQISE